MIRLRFLTWLLVVFCMLVLSITVFGASEFVFQYGLKGYEETADTHITEYSGNNGNNMGANIENECCEYDPANIDAKSILIWFDISEIPKSSPVTKATLELYMTSTRNGTNKKSVSANRLLKKWAPEAEGTGTGIDGIAAKATEVCGKWTGIDGVLWDTVGCEEPDKDFVADPDDTIEIAGDVGWYSWEIPKMTQYWINNPGKNYGAILREPRPHAATLGTKVFASKENANKDWRPMLTINVSALGVEVGRLAATWAWIKL